MLRGLDVPFRYRRQERNTRYDGNLRNAIDLATGRYCFLLGNDDMLAAPTVLSELHTQICASGNPEVVVTNYADYATKKETRIVQTARLLSGGPDVAIRTFRNLSFVSRANP